MNLPYKKPRKSIPKARLQLQIPRGTVHNFLHKRLDLRAYKIQIIQQIKPGDKDKMVNFAASVLDKIDENNSYLDHVRFSDESTFHIWGKVNRHNCRIWGSANPFVLFQHECDSPKVNVWSGLLKDRVIDLFCSCWTYSDWFNLSRYVGIVCRVIASCRNHLSARWHSSSLHSESTSFLMTIFPDSGLTEDPRQSLGHHGHQIYHPWTFSMRIRQGSSVQNTVADLDDLKLRICLAIQNVTIDMLRNTWIEVENRLDICRAVNSSHVEVYWNCNSLDIIKYLN